MKSASEIMQEKIQNTHFKDPNISIVSNVTATSTINSGEIKKLLVQQIEKPVRWRESILNIVNNGVKEFIEMRPGKVLSGLVKRIDRNMKLYQINSLSDLEKNFNDRSKEFKYYFNRCYRRYRWLILEKLSNFQANIIATGTNEKKLGAIKEKFPNVIVEKFDLSNHEQIEKFVEKCNNTFQNKIDVLVNNAGITKDNLAIRMSNEEWSKVIDINLSSTFLFKQKYNKKNVKNKSGKIINITSVVGHSGNVGQSNYSASKAAIIGMSKSLALEYGKKNIKINCVSPGFITSDMTDKISDEYKSILKSRIPLEDLAIPLMLLIL